MSTWSGYVLGEITRRMAVILLIALLALLAERLLRIVDLVTAWHGGLLAVFEMLAYLVPHYLRVALPAAFFVAVFMTFSRLARDTELDAMMAAGCGLHRFLGPLWGCALALMALQVALIGWAEPLARYAYRAGVHAVTSASFNRLLDDRAFITLGRTTYTADAISADRRRLLKPFLFSQEDNGASVVGTAHEAAIVPGNQRQPLSLELRDGLHQVIAPGPADTGSRSLPSTMVMRFRMFETTVGEPLRPFRPRGKDERELTLAEIWQSLDITPARLDKAALVAEFHSQLILTLAMPVLPLLAIPLALGRRRPQRSYGFVIGFVLLLIFNEVVQFGERMIASGHLGPGAGLWLPFAAFTLLCLGLFWRAAFGLHGLVRINFARPTVAQAGSARPLVPEAGAP